MKFLHIEQDDSDLSDRSGASLSGLDSTEASNTDDAQYVASRARIIVANDMIVESIQIPHDTNRHGVAVLRGRLLRPSYEFFTAWVDEFKRIDCTPTLSHEGDDGTEQVTLRVVAGVAPPTNPRVWINVVLFLATILSTLFFGALYASSDLSVDSVSDAVRFLLQGWPFAATLLGILVAHEFGHYFAARYHNVSVSLPYFIPMPFGFGTLGAFIRMREPVPDRRKLFDIGVAGPIAGLVIAVPLLFVGLSTSPVEVPTLTPGAVLEGNSILYYFAKVTVFGKPLPNPITGEDVLMNQVTFAAWFGLLITALNLLPVGQLDGGHTVYALFGKRARYVNIATMGFMTVLAIAGLAPLQQMFPKLITVGYAGWFFWLALILFLIGPFHPPALDDIAELDFNRRLVGYLVILFFVITFVPVPMRPLL